ncbi:MAG: type II secretion system F family protein, partial [archaeon]
IAGMKKRLGVELALAGIHVPAEKYLEDSVKWSVVLGIFFWVVFALAFENLFFGLVVFAAFFAAALLFCAYFPMLLKKRNAQIVEKELPFALMNLSIELSCENRFEKALKSVAEKNPNEVGKELGIALKEINGGGASVQQALLNICSRNDSEPLKRGIMRVITIYEQGGSRKAKGHAVRGIAREELAVQRAKSKEFSQKLVLFSMLFIVVSAVFPALFQAFVIVGSSFMQLDFLPVHMLLIVTVLFPLIDLAALFFIRSMTPHFLR